MRKGPTYLRVLTWVYGCGVFGLQDRFSILALLRAWAWSMGWGAEGHITSFLLSKVRFSFSFKTKKGSSEFAVLTSKVPSSMQTSSLHDEWLLTHSSLEINHVNKLQPNYDTHRHDHATGSRTGEYPFHF